MSGRGKGGSGLLPVVAPLPELMAGGYVGTCIDNQYSSRKSFEAYLGPTIIDDFTAYACDLESDVGCTFNDAAMSAVLGEAVFNSYSNINTVVTPDIDDGSSFLYCAGANCDDHFSIDFTGTSVGNSGGGVNGVGFEFNLTDAENAYATIYFEDGCVDAIQLSSDSLVDKDSSLPFFGVTSRNVITRIEVDFSITRSATKVLIGSLTYGSADNDPTNELQSLILSGSTLSITDGNDVDLSALINDADNDPTNEFQNLALVGSILSITDGNDVDLSSLVNGLDGDPNNEIQTLIFEEATLSISDGNDVDLSNLLQNLTLEETTLSIADGNEVDLSNLVQNLSLKGSTLSITPGNGAGVDLSSITSDLDVNDSDADPTNELQSLSLQGSKLSITPPAGNNGDEVDLSSVVTRLTYLQASIENLEGQSMDTTRRHLHDSRTSNRQNSPQRRLGKKKKEAEPPVVHYGIGCTRGWVLVEEARVKGISIVPNESLKSGSIHIRILANSYELGTIDIVEGADTHFVTFNDPTTVPAGSLLYLEAYRTSNVDTTDDNAVNVAVMLEQ